MEEKMIRKPSFPLRLLAASAALILGGACILETAAGQTAAPQIIVVTATSQPGLQESQEQAPPPGGEPEATFTPGLTLTPTISPSATIAPPTMTAGQDLSCVKGPQWILYEWVAKISEGETVTLLARSPAEWPDYFYVRKAGGTECWAFGGSSTISGDTSTLPVREAPPLPVVQYTIENKTGLRVPVVFIRGKDETDWGANRLSAILYPGEKVSIAISAGFYDVKILDEAFFTLYEEQDRPIGSDPNYRYTALDDEYEFYVQNNFAFDLCTFSFRPHGGSTWTVLHSAADGHVAPGAKAWFKLIPGFYDVAVYRCTGPMAGAVTTHYVGPAIEGFNVP
jgi:hypothetical protein